MMINPPLKPFPNYKWRWAVLTPTESLNDPPVFLGVLRIFNKFQNYPPSSLEVMQGLGIVQKETNTNVDLVRTQERNLLRNSGQYWRALGLLEEAHGKILVSPLGQMLASGEITQVEFATTVIKTLELPNVNIENSSEWEKVGLTVKPLELILEVLSELSKKYGQQEGYLTPYELVKITIPLAGEQAPVAKHTDAIIQNRNKLLDLSNWPDCAPNSNDRRMAREFLIFLSKYGFLNVVSTIKGNDNERYFLASISIEEVLELHNLHINVVGWKQVVNEIRETQIPANIERKRVSREILERPYQNVFRKNILLAYQKKCLITGVNIDNVLEAAHIIDVKYNGSDRIENGLCLRSDIHQLFDSGNLKILPNGKLWLSETASLKDNYEFLPKQIEIPHFVNRDNLEWRFNYT
ncbi:HNH endonuclease [Flavobacterium tructae]|uniref:HNH endonuclease n=1 Tax=Flavobacterium tructae TaxID=1114873 RepID=UPI002551F40B|nr:HNH endonuclease [Flavobacterium tructae]MDL2143855.1 HNH endonuclease [Flavobacterium tructae]